MIDVDYAVSAIISMAAVTVLLRAAPFLAAPLLNRYPIVERLGRFLPAAIMTLLVLHSVRGNSSQNAADIWQELVAVSVVLVLQLWLRQALVSIFAGTLLYVAFRHAAFLG